MIARLEQGKESHPVLNPQSVNSLKAGNLPVI